MAARHRPRGLCRLAASGPARHPITPTDHLAPPARRGHRLQASRPGNAHRLSAVGTRTRLSPAGRGMRLLSGAGTAACGGLLIVVGPVPWGVTRPLRVRRTFRLRRNGLGLTAGTAPTRSSTRKRRQQPHTEQGETMGTNTVTIVGRARLGPHPQRRRGPAVPDQASDRRRGRRSAGCRACSSRAGGFRAGRCGRPRRDASPRSPTTGGAAPRPCAILPSVGGAG
jgi:hypothetical protein